MKFVRSALISLAASLAGSGIAAQQVEAPLPEIKFGGSAFSGERALEHIGRQVDGGPRVYGLPGYRNALKLYKQHFGQYADSLAIEPLIWKPERRSGKTLFGNNLIARFNPDAQPRIVLAAHWDSRPISDNDRRHRDQPTPGANDGASGVAVLMELAQLLHDEGTERGIDLILFDLEDRGNIDGLPFAIGAELFLRQHPDYQAEWGVLLDMVCDPDLEIAREGHSRAYAADWQQQIWAFAAVRGHTIVKNRDIQPISDDHVPFLRRGIAMVNFIHYPFPDYWHTSRDTQDKCSATTLKKVGDLVYDLVLHK